MRSSSKIKAVLQKYQIDATMNGGRVTIVIYDKEKGESGFFEDLTFGRCIEQIFKHLKKEYKVRNSW